MEEVEKVGCSKNEAKERILRRKKEKVMRTPIEICCEECESKNVRRDAFASWDEENQQWELSEVFDNGVYQDCEDEVNLKERELE